ncbi:hypothetical protein [Spongiimicrobium salis]|uniref:hypothetical protein n=1 Tax=Spongiimicrobium salis TaxID=1667022 RepID=UPI00374D1130
MKNIVWALLFIGSGMLYAQDEFNAYQYIIVPKKFDNFKKENQHQSSTLIKYLLVQKGLPAIYDDALPKELRNNRCLALLASIDEVSSLFSTKLKIVFKDCNAQEVFVTEQGRSKKKEFKAAYTEAIGKAMASLDGVNYKFSAKKEMKRIPGELIVETIEENTTLGKQNKVVEQIATPQEQSYKDKKPVDLPRKTNNAIQEVPAVASQNVLYAQAIANGYQLVDSTPKIKMKIFKTSMSNVFLAKQDTVNGMVYEKNGNWFFEYYAQEKLVVEALNIKF